MRTTLAILALLLLAPLARADFHEFKNVPVDPALEARLRHVAEDVLKQYPKLAADNLALSVVDLSDPNRVVRADHRGDAPFYPASVIKLFFMAETFHQGKEKDPDVPRALREMIVVSDNDATAYIVDVISGTSSGPELQGKELADFIDCRRVANEWLSSMAYNVSAMMKPWSFGPFGRDIQAVGANRENRNRATANSVASLLLWIIRRSAVSPAASDAMMALMARPLDPPQKDENQIKEFIGEALPSGSKLWSKAGWTSEVRHDGAYVELPGGKKLVLVIFTRGTADDVTLVPAIAKKVLAELM